MACRKIDLRDQQPELVKESTHAAGRVLIYDSFSPRSSIPSASEPPRFTAGSTTRAGILKESTRNEMGWEGSLCTGGAVRAVVEALLLRGLARAHLNGRAGCERQPLSRHRQPLSKHMQPFSKGPPAKSAGCRRTRSR